KNVLSVKRFNRFVTSSSVELIDSVISLFVNNDVAQETRRSKRKSRDDTARLADDSAVTLWKAEEFDQNLMSLTSAEVLLRNSSSGRNGSIETFTAPASGCYLIEAAGARGGNNALMNFGGPGAQVSARVNLTAGTQLSIVVGQTGGSTSLSSEGGGGGGGSFVYRTNDQLLLLAAGGGGGAGIGHDGRPGQVGTNGSDSIGAENNKGFGGINGQPGSNNPSGTPSNSDHGGCGAGWLGRAVNPRRSSWDGKRGGSRAQGWVGGSAGGGSACHGGFGGGGGCGCMRGSIKGAAGGGGGFSGGGAGVGRSHIGGG
uniref:PPC domain-containing protein n=1 Tax=Macrostomum lignano TaxID=282301 RepID=A0A1I8HXU6_9PLAT